MEDSGTRTTLEVVRRFNDAFNRHDVDGVMALMTDTCVFENTFPAPDGERYEGQAAVRGVDVMKVRDGKVAEKLAYVKG